MNTIKLYGALGQEFGTEHRASIATPAEAIQMLVANFPRIVNRMRHGFYRVVVGKTASKGVTLDKHTILTIAIGDGDTIHIVPKTSGSKRGLGKVIAGILLIGLAVTGAAPLLATSIGSTGLTVGSVVGQIGLGLTLTGVASMLAPEADGDDKQKSFTMTGPQVTMKEGGIVPIAYGEVITGGTMISGKLRVENDAIGAT